MYSLTFVPLAMMMSGVLADASAEILLLPDDPRGIVDEPLEMWCSTFEGSRLKASDLEIVIEHRDGVRHQVNHRRIAILNDTTIKMTYPKLSISMNDAHITCQGKDNSTDGSPGRKPADEPFDVQLLSVGYRPFKPVIQKNYLVYNWEYFTFRWTINETDPVYSTEYKAWYRATTTTDFSCCTCDNKSSRKQECRISDALRIVHPNGLLLFKVNASNAVGSVTSNVEQAYLFHLIQPGKVKNVSVSSSVSTGVSVSCFPPNKEASLKYRISVQCGNTTWPDVILKNLSSSKSKKPIQSKVDLPFPPFTSCSLSVSCLPFHNRQYWSEPSEWVTFVSPDAVPLIGPEICCFEIVYVDSVIRNVTIYFKHLTDLEARGQVVQYWVQYVSSRGQSTLPHADQARIGPDELSTSLELYMEQKYNLSFDAETRAGRNQTAVSMLTLPSQNDVLSFVENATAISYGSRNIRVSWIPKEGPFSYIIVWCTSSFDLCESPISWKQTNVSFYDLTLSSGENFHLRYRYGVVASSVDGRQSAIHWLKCSYNIDAVASVPSVTLLNKTSHVAFFHLEKPDCIGKRVGYIYQYQIEYGTGGIKKTVVLNDAVDRLIEISDLEPNSYYTVQVVAMTAAGPSEAKILRFSTDWALPVYAIVLIAVATPIVVILALIGVYACVGKCRKVPNLFQMKIVFPEKEKPRNRGEADGMYPSHPYMSPSENLHSSGKETMTTSLDTKEEEERSDKQVSGSLVSLPLVHGICGSRNSDENTFQQNRASCRREISLTDVRLPDGTGSPPVPGEQQEHRNRSFTIDGAQRTGARESRCHAQNNPRLCDQDVRSSTQSGEASRTLPSSSAAVCEVRPSGNFQTNDNTSSGNGYHGVEVEDYSQVRTTDSFLPVEPELSAEEIPEGTSEDDDGYAQALDDADSSEEDESVDYSTANFSQASPLLPETEPQPIIVALSDAESDENSADNQPDDYSRACMI